MGLWETILLTITGIKDLLEIISILWGPFSQEISYVKDLHSNLGTLTSETKKLKRKRDDCEADVEFAESVGMKRLCRVGDWLQDVDKIVPEVDSIQLEFEQATSNLYLQRKVGKRVVEKIEDVKKLHDKGSFDKVAKRPRRSPEPETHLPKQLERQSTSLETLSSIAQALCDEEIGIICIYGVSGIGKTTLTKAIYNRFLGTGNFNPVIWITVTKDFNLQIIQKNIGKQLGMQVDGKEGLEEKTRDELYASLRNVRYMLILDDLRQAFSLDQVGVPGPSKKNGCKIIITTRISGVCSAMKVDRKIQAKPLGREEAWNLFCSRTGKVALLPEIMPLAKKVLKECHGIPRSIEALGWAMEGKDKKEQWKNALKKLKRSLKFC